MKIERLQSALSGPSTRIDLTELKSLERRFDQAMADDLDTPTALAALDVAARLILDAPVSEGTGEGHPSADHGGTPGSRRIS